jgi:hypothetical protein
MSSWAIFASGSGCGPLRRGAGVAVMIAIAAVVWLVGLAAARLLDALLERL